VVNSHHPQGSGIPSLFDGLDSRKPPVSRSAATTASKLLKLQSFHLLSMVNFRQLEKRKMAVKYHRIPPPDLGQLPTLPRSPSISPLPPARHSKPSELTSTHKPCHSATKARRRLARDAKRRLISSTSYRSLQPRHVLVPSSDIRLDAEQRATGDW
jgi:hypothetical protein